MGGSVKSAVGRKNSTKETFQMSTFTPTIDFNENLLYAVWYEGNKLKFYFAFKWTLPTQFIEYKSIYKFFKESRAH